jgi:hypothetical protein
VTTSAPLSVGVFLASPRSAAAFGARREQAAVERRSAIQERSLAVPLAKQVAQHVERLGPRVAHGRGVLVAEGDDPSFDGETAKARSRSARATRVPREMSAYFARSCHPAMKLLQRDRGQVLRLSKREMKALR